MHFRPVFYVIGLLLLVLAAAMTAPIMIDLADHSDDWQVFASAQAATAFIGLALVFMNRRDGYRITLRETFLLTCLGWVFMAGFGALPFVFSQAEMDFTGGFFEAMSAITTTGSTAITGIDALPRGIILWRFMLLWIGGIGFLIIALAVFPLLQISGMQIFKTQSFQIEKVMPSASQMAAFICLIYTALTALCGIFLYCAGMSPFDALCHAMAAISTGGISTHDAAIAWFDSPLIELILVTFMIAGGIPFVLYLRVLRGDRKAIWHDSQVRTFLAILGFLTVACAIWLISSEKMEAVAAIRSALFLTVSYITTTGFVNGDHSHWGHFSVGIAFLSIFVGSCSGSTAGGIKIFRLQILFLMLKQQLSKLMTPHGVFQVHYNGKLVEPSVQAAVAGFFFVYIMSWLVIGVTLQLTGLDFETAFSGAISALSNTGVGTGDLIGPSGNFANLPASSIWVMSFAMLFGRIEFLTLLVLFVPRFWRG
ncbi:MAG TPA: TrkH family potassium uptake protein [Patescibacteria group bacterium]|nr:TrkH family potassium uptake protein [Patescibacteria group bacterium]